MKIRVRKKVPVRIRIEKEKLADIAPGVDVVNLAEYRDDDWDYDFSDDDLYESEGDEHEPEADEVCNGGIFAEKPKYDGQGTGSVDLSEKEESGKAELQTAVQKSLPAEIGDARDSLTYLNQRTPLAEWATPMLVMLSVIMIFVGAGIKYRTDYMAKQYAAQREMLAEVRSQEQKAVIEEDKKAREEAEEAARKEAEEKAKLVYREDGVVDLLKSHEQTMDDAPIMAGMQEIYDMNNDSAGWLKIDDTAVDYVVMQSFNNEEYYLDRDFQGNYSAYGCLIMDTDSQIGSGTKSNEYADGSIPCTNLIIHGHNMKNGTMFGGLDLYRQQSYEKEHNIIKFSSLYEEREYEVCAVFLSQVFLKTQTDVFKYYKFFQADTEEEFNDFYKNIKEMSLYDTGVTAEFGDEFITLSVCAYHVENGRLVVVGKRIK